MAIFGYARVGTGKQPSGSQRLELERAGYPVSKWFADEGVSSKVPALQRAQFRTLLHTIRDSETLVVPTIDSLGSNARDIGSTISMLAMRRIQVIVLQLGKLDLASAAGELVLKLLAAMAATEETESTPTPIRAKSKILGRPTSTTDEQRAAMRMRYQGGCGESISALARDFGISRASVMRIVKPSSPCSTPEHNHDMRLLNASVRGSTRRRIGITNVQRSPDCLD